MNPQTLLEALGAEVEDHEEETFLLFSQTIPSQNLGFVDSKATVIQVTVGNQDLSIQQSPTVLISDRDGGTTGAVVWRITPLFAGYMVNASNLFIKHNVLTPDASILELGCGVSGIIGLTLGSFVSTYVLTDQEYVLKLLNRNLLENRIESSSYSKKRKKAPKPTRGASAASTVDASSVVIAKTLDWETDEVTASLAEPSTKRSFDAVIACDCIYNEALIGPFVQTCVDVCMLRNLDDSVQPRPTVCIVAQQLRSPEIFEAWLKTFTTAFRVWRVPDSELTTELQANTGFVVHVGILR